MVSSHPSALPLWAQLTPTVDVPGLWLIQPDKREMKPGIALPLAVGLHVGIVVLVLLWMFLAQLFGWTIPLLNLDQLKPRDLEFVLVEAPKQKPRDPNTRNRAQQDSRSGGRVIKNMPKSQANLLKGRVAPKPQPKATPTPAKQATRPAPRPQPVQKPTRPTQPKQAKPVTQQPKQRQPVNESPMSPKVKPAPTPAPSRPAPPPRVRKVAPAVALPNPAGEENLPTGPVLTRSGRSSSHPSPNGGSSSSPRPSQIPGDVSSQPSSSGSPGSRGNSSAGQGGAGSFSQSGSPGGGGGRPGIDAIGEPDFGPYIAEVQRRIKRNWAPPADSQTRKIVVLFTINRNGALQSARIQRSSGMPVADQAAIQSIQASAPFRPLPPQYRNNSIDIIFTFDYNVLTGGRVG